MRRTMTCLLGVLFSVPALAQTDGTYLLTSTNTVSPGSPKTTIGIWATWTDPRVEYIFGVGDYDLTAGDGLFSNPVNKFPGFGSTTGVITGNVITGAVLGQIHMPFLGLIGSRDNPILLATYDWTTSNFTTRSVSLDTSNTTGFVVQTWDTSFGNSNTRNLFPWSFTAGSGVINVVPAPGAWMVLALPIVAATRRRRS